jgi:hypothetical protein
VFRIPIAAGVVTPVLPASQLKGFVFPTPNVVTSVRTASAVCKISRARLTTVNPIASPLPTASTQTKRVSTAVAVALLVSYATFRRGNACLNAGLVPTDFYVR